MSEQKTVTTVEDSLLSALPDGITWALPVFNAEGLIEDFEYAYHNAVAATLIGRENGSLNGLRVLRDGIPSRETAENNFRSLLQVYQTEEPSEISLFARSVQQEVEILRKVHQGGVISISRDRRAQREAERNEKEKAQLLNGVIENAPIGIVAYDAERDLSGEIQDFRVKIYNSSLHAITSISEEDRKKLSLKELFQKVGVTDRLPHYKKLVETGEPFASEYYVAHFDRWFNTSAVKMGDGLLILISDITAIKNSNEALQEQSDYLQSILNSSFNGIFTCEAVRDTEGRVVDLKIIQANNVFTNLNAAGGEVLNTSLLERFPNVVPSGAFEKYCRVLETGRADRFEIFYEGEGLSSWFDISVVKVGGDGIVITFMDITDRKKAAQEMEQQKALLENILKHTSNGISIGEMIRDQSGEITDIRTVLANDAALKFTGFSKERYLSQTATELDPGFKESAYFEACKRCMETGEPFITQYFLEPVGKWLEVSVSRMDHNRQIYVFTDVTSIKEAQIAIERSAQKLQTVIDTSPTGIFLAEPVLNDEGKIDDFRFGMVNGALATFAGQTPEALHGELGSRWFTRYKTNGLFERLRDGFLRGSRQQFDFHYVAESMEVWVNIVSTRIKDELLVSVTNFTPIKRLQLKLEESVEELQRSNASLEEFAYAASHDLQEPLRKISTFSNKLKLELKGQLTEKQEHLFDRTINAAHRMRVLIDDLLTYSQASAKPDLAQKVNLNNELQQVLNDLETAISDSSALIQVEPLPSIRGNDRQLRQLFQNLISNALKYRKPGVAPHISITCRDYTGPNEAFNFQPEVGKNYYLIEVADNGIGFEQENAHKIFQVFQRLHGRAEYEGTGVGLAIVKKVVDNHEGVIIAQGRPDNGATFSLLFPK